MAQSIKPDNAARFHPKDFMSFSLLHGCQHHKPIVPILVVKMRFLATHAKTLQLLPKWLLVNDFITRGGISLFRYIAWGVNNQFVFSQPRDA